MATERRFAAFSKKAVPPRMRRMPEGGMCISAFVIISKRSEPRSVLMGKIDKNANWDHIGALDPKRVERLRMGWMLPSSHLMLYETPEGAARRILREQLEHPRHEARRASDVRGHLGDRESLGHRFHLHGDTGPVTEESGLVRAAFRAARRTQG